MDKEIEKCRLHDKAIDDIKTEFGEFKVSVSSKLDDISERIKPQFTSAQLTGFLITLLAMMAGSIIYVESIKQQSQNTKDQLEKHERLKAEQMKDIFIKMDKIYDIALETNKSVAVLEAANEIEKQKQKIRNWENN